MWSRRVTWHRAWVLNETRRARSGALEEDSATSNVEETAPRVRGTENCKCSAKPGPHPVQGPPRPVPPLPPFKVALLQRKFHPCLPTSPSILLHPSFFPPLSSPPLPLSRTYTDTQARAHTPYTHTKRRWIPGPSLAASTQAHVTLACRLRSGVFPSDTYLP